MTNATTDSPVKFQFVRAVLLAGMALTTWLSTRVSGQESNSPPPSAPTIAVFEQGLGEVSKLMEKQRWDRARTRLLAVLEENRDQPYVWSKRLEVEDMMQRCVFGVNYESPDFKALVSGRLHYYNRRSGTLKISYQPDTMGDFTDRFGTPGGNSKSSRDQWRKDLERLSRELERARESLSSSPSSAQARYVHPAKFRGSHSIQVEGKSYPHLGVSMFVAVQEDSYYVVVFGTAPSKTSTPSWFGRRQSRTWIPPQLFRVHDGAKESIELKEKTSIQIGKPFTVKVSVTRTEIRATYNGKLLLRARRPEEPYGFIGLSAPSFDDIMVDGKVEGAWIEGLADAATQRQVAEFERDYDPAQHLPDWIRKAPADTPEGEPSSSADQTEDQTDETGSAEKWIDRFVDAGELEKAERFIEMFCTDDVSAGRQAFLQAYLASRAGRIERAIEHAVRACEAEPSLIEAHRLRIESLQQLKRKADLPAACHEFVTSFPGRADIHEEIALLLLRAGHSAPAKAVMEHAALHGLRSPDIEIIHRLLVKSSSGPDWPQRSDYSTRNYMVSSDISRQLCVEVAWTLQRAFEQYQKRLRPLDQKSRRRFAVYIFSGESSYKEYCKDIHAELPIHTAGLYSSALKQLLVWNLPIRAQMLQTVRHEGLHQYLDFLMDNPPLWFNEGLAEYYELATDEGGIWSEGQINAQHVTLLSSSSAPNLSVFLHQDRESFYADPHLHYATSWAFIHFLRHTSPENRELFDALFNAFMENQSNQKAMDQAFTGVDLAALDREFRDYLRGLEDR